MDIYGSGALVVGGASGLGEATARHLHAAGAVVTIADVNAEQGQALADELGVGFVACDVREEDQVQAAVDAAAEADGGLRISVCCAGTGWAQRTASSKGPHPLDALRDASSRSTCRDLQRPAPRRAAMIGERARARRRARRVRQHRLDRRLRRAGRPDRLLARPRAASSG